MYFRVLAVLSLLAAAGCSIKEDRSSCLCHMVVDLSMPSEIVALSAAGEELDTLITGSGPVILEVPRKVMQIIVSSGARPQGKKGFMIPEGEMCPEFLSWSGVVDARGEEVRCRPVMRKHYCALTLRLKGRFPGENPFSMRLKGDVCGLDPSGRPVGGSFLYRVCIPEDTVRIPRQSDGSLSLQIVKDGETVHDFAIGEALMAAGYDWLMDDLEDRIVEVDYAMNTLYLSEADYSQGPPSTLIL